MKLFFEERAFSWFDNYEILDEEGRKAYMVKGDSKWGHVLKVYDSFLHGTQVATLKQSRTSSAVEVKHKLRFVGLVKKIAARMRSVFELGFLGWRAKGNFEEKDYVIFDANDRPVATIERGTLQKKKMRCIDTLPEFALHSLTFTFAIDAQSALEAQAE